MQQILNRWISELLHYFLGINSSQKQIWLIERELTSQASFESLNDNSKATLPTNQASQRPYHEEPQHRSLEWCAV